MFNRQALIKRVDNYLSSKLRQLGLEAGGVLSIVIPVQEIHLRSLPGIQEDWFFWDRPSEDETILGIGTAKAVTASGLGRLEKIGRAMQEMHDRWEWLDLEQTGLRPLSYICFAFNQDDPMCAPWNGLPNSGMFLPELTLHQRDNCCAAAFSINLQVTQDRETIQQRWMELFRTLIASISQPHSPPGCKTALTITSASPDGNHWRSLVQNAQTSISSGSLKKVVLARQLKVQAQRRFDPRQLMSTLSYLYPSSALLATHMGKGIFVSATPERLCRSAGNRIICDAIAGTVQRSALAQTDQDLANFLLADPKNRHEHDLVVEDISSSLRPLCTTMDHPEQPHIIRLRNLQHLWTVITGQLKPEINLLQVAANIHPTAAVNGFPTAAADRWLKANEPFARGWYAGAAGWIDCRGDGELAVLLRCALLDQDRADLFAGAGITAGSDADAEFAETELKFGVMLEALKNS
jgi:isochorismate synthase